MRADGARHLRCSFLVGHPTDVGCLSLQDENPYWVKTLELSTDVVDWKVNMEVRAGAWCVYAHFLLGPHVRASLHEKLCQELGQSRAITSCCCCIKLSFSAVSGKASLVCTHHISPQHAA